HLGLAADELHRRRDLGLPGALRADEPVLWPRERGRRADAFELEPPLEERADRRTDADRSGLAARRHLGELPLEGRKPLAVDLGGAARARDKEVAHLERGDLCGLPVVATRCGALDGQRRVGGTARAVFEWCGSERDERPRRAEPLELPAEDLGL